MFRSFLLLSISIGFAGGCSSEPFDYVSASGSVTYEDGTLIPAERIVVTFVPQLEQVEGKVNPPSAVAEVDPVDGTFDVVTSHRFGDGMLAGKHKVQVVALDAMQNPTAAIGREYSNASETPLEVDTANRPFHLKVRKPQ